MIIIFWADSKLRIPIPEKARIDILFPRTEVSSHGSQPPLFFDTKGIDGSVIVSESDEAEFDSVMITMEGWL